ncbi:hypothetical protein ACVWXO_005400 [Bradyrhizobium sp. LM2.7]
MVERRFAELTKKIWSADLIGRVFVMRLQELTFEEWLEHAFGRAVRFQQAPWYFDPGHDWWDPPPAQAIPYLTRLFENPEPALEGFADYQIAQGLTYLVNTMASGDGGWFCSTEVPVKERILSIESIGPFFERLLKPRCTPHLSHLSEVGAGPLNGVCYMWWDVFFRHSRSPAIRTCQFSITARCVQWSISFISTR